MDAATVQVEQCFLVTWAKSIFSSDNQGEAHDPRGNHLERFDQPMSKLKVSPVGLSIVYLILFFEMMSQFYF